MSKEGLPTAAIYAGRVQMFSRMTKIGYETVLSEIGEPRNKPDREWILIVSFSLGMWASRPELTPADLPNIQELHFLTHEEKRRLTELLGRISDAAKLSERPSSTPSRTRSGSSFSL